MEALWVKGSFYGLQNMATSVNEPRKKLEIAGVVLLRSFFSREPLTRLRDAASRCFEAIEVGIPISKDHQFIRQANSVQLTALLDFGIGSKADLLAPLAAKDLNGIFLDVLGGLWRCRLEHSWVRKKFAPRNAPASGYHIQNWHQDGALGAQFPLQPGPPMAPAALATCWIPLSACGRESPGLEFIHKPQTSLLHFTDLHDSVLRQRFGPAEFWAPALEFGDGLVFRNDILHRTHVHQEMRRDRISVEYRIFPAEG